MIDCRKPEESGQIYVESASNTCRNLILLFKTISLTEHFRNKKASNEDIRTGLINPQGTTVGMTMG